MINYPFNLTNSSFVFPKIIWLELEHFKQAREISNKVAEQAYHWQTYLNILALVGLEAWLGERIPDKLINLNTQQIEQVGYLNVGEFKVCLLASEHLLDEVVSVPQDAIEQPELAAHFYIVLEVDEEQEQVIIRGVLRYDELVNYLQRKYLQWLENGCYQLPLSLFDAEPNHLLFYCRKLEPTAIPLPVSIGLLGVMPSLTKTEEKFPRYLKETRTKLSQWLQDVFDEAWQTIDVLSNAETHLALSTRNAQLDAKRGKLIDLEMQLGCQTVALLVTIAQETQDKLSVSIQLYPTNGERHLPPNLKLTLLSKVGKTLQEVTSRSHDNYIQLKSFKGEPGKRFSIEVSHLDVSVTEDFEI